jgi:SHS2 domain-containing protein
LKAEYELLDHTGDVGFVVRARDLPGLLEAAALALFDVIGGLDHVRPMDEVEVRAEGAVDREDLLVRFLSELLFLHDARDWMFREFRIDTVGEHRVEAMAVGERFDPERHRIHRQVKAVTYHRLKLEETDEGWSARVVLDL